jgi:glutaredoxin
MFARERFCPDVTRSRLRLSELEIPWVEHDIEADTAAGGEVQRLTGRRSVPTIVIGTRILVEPSNAQLDNALVAAGYDLSAGDDLE